MRIKSFVSTLYVWAGAYALQLVVIWWLAPSPNQFAVTRPIVGTYKYDGGNARSRTYTKIDELPIFCSASFIGPLDSCGRSYLKGTRVRADVAEYRHLFGSGEIVVVIRSGNATLLQRSADEMVSNWIFNSFLTAFLNAVIAASAFFVFRKTRPTKQDEAMA